MKRAHFVFRVFSFGVIFLAAASWLSTSVAALDTTDPRQQFAGSWRGEFQGQPFVTIKLQMQDGKLTGTISHVQIQLDAKGELSSAQPQAGEDALAETKFSGKVADLTASDVNGQSAVHYEMELTAADQAELRFVDTPSGTQVPKPWKLSKLTEQAAQRPASMKDKLAAAAQIWMAGQMGTKPASTASASPASAENSSSSASATPAAPPAPALKPSETPLDSALCKEIDQLPRRVNDQYGNQGDMVNFVIVGSQQQVQSALEAANWHVADTDSKESAIKAVLETYQKKDYLTMPMSRLYLFGRVQDFGYEQAEPYAVVASRHHFRVWKTTETWNGAPVWAGAGTHDIGFEKDQRNGKVTHKIDPAVDGERDNVGASLQKAEKVQTLAYYLPPNPVQDAHNATGGGYHSDGRVLVILLK